MEAKCTHHGPGTLLTKESQHLEIVEVGPKVVKVRNIVGRKGDYLITGGEVATLKPLDDVVDIAGRQPKVGDKVYCDKVGVGEVVRLGYDSEYGAECNCYDGAIGIDTPHAHYKQTIIQFLQFGWVVVPKNQEA